MVYGARPYGSRGYGDSTAGAAVAISTAVYVQLAGTSVLTLTANSARLFLAVRLVGTSALILSATARLKAMVALSSLSADPSQRARVILSAYASLGLLVPVAPPPITPPPAAYSTKLSKFNRNSITMPEPVLDSKGRPT